MDIVLLSISYLFIQYNTMETIESISNGIIIVFAIMVLYCLYKRDKEK